MPFARIFLGVLVALSASGADAQSRAPVSAYQSQAEQEAKQAIQQGRFPELRGLTNSPDDQTKVVQLCSRYHGADGRICGEVASFYANQSMQGYWQQQAEDRRQRAVQAQQRATAINAEKEQAAIQAQRDVAQKQEADTAARASLTSDAERSAYDTCMVFHASLGSGKQCSDEARRVAIRQAAQAAKKRQDEIARAKFAECSKTDAYKLAEATNTVAGSNFLIQTAQEQLDHDKAIEQVSGIVNLKVRQSAGEVLVSMPPQRDEEFATYKRLGGTASSAEAVHEVPSPCVNPDAP